MRRVEAIAIRLEASAIRLEVEKSTLLDHQDPIPLQLYNHPMEVFVVLSFILLESCKCFPTLKVDS